MKLSVIIPCYNEGKNIPLLFQKFSQIITDENIEIVFVNNGSSDKSQQVFAELIPVNPYAKLVNVEENQGYGYGILTGLRAATGDYIGWTHADLQTDPKDILKAYALISEAGDNNLFIKGRRRNRPFFDVFFTFGMTFFELLYLGKFIPDINAQPTIFHKDFFATWKTPPHDFSLDLYAFYLALKKKQIVKRFDVLFPERIHGTSTWNTGFQAKYKFIKRTIDFSRKLKKEGIE